MRSLFCVSYSALSLPVPCLIPGSEKLRSASAGLVLCIHHHHSHRNSGQRESDSSRCKCLLLRNLLDGGPIQRLIFCLPCLYRIRAVGCLCYHGNLPDAEFDVLYPAHPDRSASGEPLPLPPRAEKLRSASASHCDQQRTARTELEPSLGDLPNLELIRRLILYLTLSVFGSGLRCLLFYGDLPCVEVV